MRKFMTAAMAALTLVGGMAAATTADAQHRYRGHNDTSTAIAAGVAGLALGAALGSRGGYSTYSYGYGYPSYGYGYGRPYYGRPYYGGYYAPRRHYRPRYCTYWRYDRWGRAYPVQGRC